MGFYRLHREGYTTVALSLVLLCVLVALLYWRLPAGYRWLAHLAALAGAVLFGLILNFFRNPVVVPTHDPGAVVAPCDGTVVLVQEVDDQRYLGRRVRQISIFMSPLNVHVNRSPVAGRVVHAEYRPGKYLVAWHPKSSELNEHTYLVVEGPHGPVGFKQIAGAVARRIRYYVAVGDSLGQGQEFGFIKFGSRCDVLVPLDWPVVAQIGQKTKAGVSVVSTVPMR